NGGCTRRCRVTACCPSMPATPRTSRAPTSSRLLCWLVSRADSHARSRKRHNRGSKMTASALQRDNEVSDLALLAGVAAGEEAAFTVLVHRYQHRFYGVARRMLGNDADAEDAVQTAFVIVFRK